MLKTYRSLWPGVSRFLRISITDKNNRLYKTAGTMSADAVAELATTTTDKNTAVIEDKLTVGQDDHTPTSHKMDTGNSGTRHVVPVPQTQPSADGMKRTAEDTPPSGDNKKLKVDPQSEKTSGDEQNSRIKRRKGVLLMVYSGEGYFGMQRNPPHRTIEGDLLDALFKADLITQEHYDYPNRAGLNFQRVSKTDKGVSAAGQVVSMKLPYPFEEGLVPKINQQLSDQICVLGIKRATKGFNAKNNCHARTYSYMLPTYAFAPIEEATTEEFRVTDEIMKSVNETLALYKGTHNFHNFTSGKKPEDRSAYRYIIDFQCGPQFVKDDLEFAVIKVKGQSFMIHQIRKMIGLMIAVVRGFATRESIGRAWKPHKYDVPKAPALGLMLEQVHYDQYNKRYGNDGFHEAISWEEYKEKIDEFKDKYIYPNVLKVEKEEKSMMSWLSTLPLHNYDLQIEGYKTGVNMAKQNVAQLDKQTKEQEKITEDSVSQSSTTLRQLDDQVSQSKQDITLQINQSEKNTLSPSDQSEQGCVSDVKQSEADLAHKS